MARIIQGTGTIVLSGIETPDTDNDAANKGYVDTHVLGKDLGSLTPTSGDILYYENNTNRWIYRQYTDVSIEDLNDVAAPAVAPTVNNRYIFQFNADSDYALIPFEGTDREPVFTDSESGLVPAPGTGRDEHYFLAANGVWRHVGEFIADSDDIIIQLREGLNSRWVDSTGTLQIYGDVHKPAVPGTNGQRAWFNLTVTADSTNNPDNDHELDLQNGELALTLRSPGADSDANFIETTIHFHNPNIEGHDWPPVGTTDVAEVVANMIADHYSDRFTDVDIGGADGTTSIQMTNSGLMSATDGDSTYPIVEFNSTQYNIAATYAQPGASRGRTGEYTNGANATGRWHTNGTPDTDSEILLISQQVPDFNTTRPGLTPRPPSGEARSTPSNWWVDANGVWRSLPTTSYAGLAPARPSTGQDTSFLRADNTWAEIDAEVTYDNVTAAIGAVDSWFGSDTEYHVNQTTGGITSGQIKFFGTGSTPSLNLTASSAFRIVVAPHAGTHTDVMAGMELGSIVRATYGNAEVVFALSSAPSSSGTPPVYTFQASGATHYVGTGTFVDDTELTFEFRPAPENPVVPADLVPGAVRAEAINGGEISPFHLQLESTGTANPRQAGFYPVSAGTANDAGWTWHEAHTGTVIPAAEGINDPAVHNVYRVPATGTQEMQKGTVAFTTLNASSAWGFIDRESGTNTIFDRHSSCYVGRYRRLVLTTTASGSLTVLRGFLRLLLLFWIATTLRTMD